MDTQKDNIIIDEDQIRILNEILKEENSKKVQLKVPKDEFNEEQEIKGGYSSAGSKSSGSNTNIKIKNKYGYSFNINGFESNSIAYLNEILLGKKNENNCFNVNFNFNDLIRIDKSTVDFCRLMLNDEVELVGDVDGVITNVKNDELLKAKNENLYNIFTSKNFFQHDKTYDIFCESTFGLIDKLRKGTDKQPNRKIVQLKKLICLINIIDNINEKIKETSDDLQRSLKKKVNNIFHHNGTNKITLCILVDGNYKHLIETIKNSCLFSKEWKDNNDKGIMQNLYTYFKILRDSKIPFLIVYCPRFYERKSQYFNPISKIYEEDMKDNNEILMNSLVNENEQLKLKISQLEEYKTKQDAKIERLEVELSEIKEQMRGKKKKTTSNILGEKRKRMVKKMVKKKQKKSGNEDNKESK